MPTVAKEGQSLRTREGVDPPRAQDWTLSRRGPRQACEAVKKLTRESEKLTTQSKKLTRVGKKLTRH